MPLTTMLLVLMVLKYKLVEGKSTSVLYSREPNRYDMLAPTENPLKGSKAAPKYACVIPPSPTW